MLRMLLLQVLRNAISKTVNRTVDFRKELITANKALDSAKSAVSKAVSNLEIAQGLLDSADTEEAQTQATAKTEWAKSVLEKRKNEEILAEEALEAKDALLSRALKEQEVENQRMQWIIYITLKNVEQLCSV